jgi:hypothetical protein
MADGPSGGLGLAIAKLNGKRSNSSHRGVPERYLEEQLAIVSIRPVNGVVRNQVPGGVERNAIADPLHALEMVWAVSPHDPGSRLNQERGKPPVALGDNRGPIRLPVDRNDHVVHPGSEGLHGVEQRELGVRILEIHVPDSGPILPGSEVCLVITAREDAESQTGDWDDGRPLGLRQILTRTSKRDVLPFQQRHGVPKSGAIGVERVIVRQGHETDSGMAQHVHTHRIGPKVERLGGPRVLVTTEGNGTFEIRQEQVGVAGHGMQRTERVRRTLLPHGRVDPPPQHHIAAA